jgi:3-oxoacyl-[acyl-carrier-protein] synthase II
VSDNGRPRVVVTGIGVISPLGIGIEDTWKRLVDGGSGAGEITLFDTTGFDVRYACEADEFRPEDFLEHRAARRMDRFAQMAVAAAILAMSDAGLSGDSDRLGAIVASGAGGGATREAQLAVMRDRGPDRVSPLAIPATVPNMAAAQVSMTLGARGPVTATCTACAAGTDAIGAAAATLRRGAADVMLAGGADAMITPLWVAGFNAMRVLTHPVEDPAVSPRPFDVERDGFLVGEAGAVLVLERAEDAAARGARALVEVLGYGASADANHMTDPDTSGVPQSRAIRTALADAGVEPEAVGYVNAHGGGSRAGDPAEVTALRRALGDDVAAGVPISATKAAHGHCMGAAGALEASIAAMAIIDETIPATLNLASVDPACTGIDHVMGSARRTGPGVAISCSFGLGGHNSCVVLGAPGDR